MPPSRYLTSDHLPLAIDLVGDASQPAVDPGASNIYGSKRARLRMLKRSLVSLGFACLVLAGAPGAAAQTVTAIPHLDLDSLTGKWYEIARYPEKSERKCLINAFELVARAEKPKHLQVVNSCSTRGGFINIRNGTIWPANKSGDGKLKLRYLWPFSTGYWLLDLDPANAWLLVGSPNRKHLWILAKSPTLASPLLARIEAKAASEGFSPDKLLLSPQTAQPDPTTPPAPTPQASVATPAP